MFFVINKCVTAVKISNFTGHYLRNCSTLYIGVLCYIGILYHKEYPPQVWHIPPVTPCIYSEGNLNRISPGPLDKGFQTEIFVSAQSSEVDFLDSTTVK